MANIKNFGIVGVGAGVQFGKGGAQLIQTAGTFAAKNAQGNAFVRFQIADGASDGDAVTFNQLTNAVSLIGNTTTAIQSELDAVETGAGLGTDGTYSAPGGSNYLANATSLKSADTLLDLALASEVARAEAAEADIANTISDASDAVTAVQNEVDLIETSVGLGTDGSLTLAAGNYLANAVDIVSAIETLDGALGGVASDSANTAALVGGLESNVATLSDTVANTVSEISDLTDRTDLLEANSSAQTGLIDGLRTDVDSNAAILAGALTDIGNLQAADTSEAAARIQGDSDNANAVADVAADVLTLSGRVDSVEANTATLTTTVAQNTTDIANNVAAIGANTSNIAAIQGSYVNKDGSVAMTGAFNAGGFAVANVATPNAVSDAATKGYVDGKVASLGNAFNYVGTLDGGATADTAFGLDTLDADGKNAGDYYKITTAGYFNPTTGGATEDSVFFNVGDGLVFNTTGGFDKIDNTDSNVAGTTNEITVTGSADIGFVVGIDGAYTTARQLEVSDEAADRIQGDSDNANAISSEVSRAEAAEAILANSISDASAGLAQEITDRANAVASEATARIAGDAANASDIANTNADVVALSGRVDSVEANAVTLTGEVSDNANAIATETTRAEAAEAALTSSVANTDANAVTLTARVDALEGAEANAVADEANARIAADNLINANVAALANTVATDGATLVALSDRVDSVQIGAGLQFDGSYSANAVSHYLANAASLKEADEALDTAVFELATELANLSQDTIRTEDNLNSVHVGAGFVVTKLDVAGVATEVANTIAGAATNTKLALDFTTADEVKLAASGTSADVDLRLAGQGAGHVIIGETGVGVIQSDTGFDMTVAAGASANLNLLGDTVKIGEADGTAIAQFTGTAGASGYATISNGNTSVAIGAAGAASNIDLVFAPKGTGTVNVSSAKVINVANATQAGDAVNFGQLNSALATATVGVVKTVVATLPATSGDVTLGTITGTILRVRVLITAGYDVGSTITVGNSGTPNDLAADTDIDESTAGIYVVETAKDYSAQTITATVTNGTGLVGAAKVIVEYLSA